MEIELNNPKIVQMAMHIVGNAKKDPKTATAFHLPATDVVHSSFFESRIKETENGCKCSFVPLSMVHTGLKDMQTGSSNFYDVSKQLADRFHSAINQQGGAVPGAFLFFEIDDAGEKLYSIIKYEHDEVVSYQNSGGKLVFQLLQKTFVKKPQAMQKSALIKFDGDQSILHVIDRSERKGITEYFSGFLGVERLFESADATKRLDSAVAAFVNRAIDKNLLNPAVKKTYRSRLYEFSRLENASFDPEKIYEFLATVVDQVSDDLVEILESELNRQRIKGEKFEISKSAISKPSRLRTKTKDGIEINFTQAHVEAGKYKRIGDMITIDVSTGLVEDASQLG